jgi:hypothetical protein
MTKARYRVGETANLDVFPHGTKVGSEIELTEAAALYERDMGRITLVEEKAAGAVAVPDGVVPGETPGWPADAVSGAPLDLTDEERARLASAPIGDGDPNAPAVLGVAGSDTLLSTLSEDERLPPADGTRKTAEGDGVEKTAVAGTTLAPGKGRGAR